MKYEQLPLPGFEERPSPARGRWQSVCGRCRYFVPLPGERFLGYCQFASEWEMVGSVWLSCERYVEKEVSDVREEKTPRG